MSNESASTDRAYEEILYDVADGVATITLDRPDQLNAFTATMMTEMIHAFDRVDADDEVRVVVVTGAGRGFCAGADLSSGSESFDYESQREASGDEAGMGEDPAKVDPSRMRDGGGLLTLRIYECTKPVIGAINGAAVGIGATMTLPMDIRLAVPTAKMGFVFARRGLVPEACSAWFLPKVVGMSTALEWTFTGRVFLATEAHEAGLVRSLHEPEDLLDVAYGLAREIADNTSAVSVAATRALLWRMASAEHPMDAHNVDSRLIYQLGTGPDVAEGVMSFLEKRPPEFTMKPSADMPEVYPWWEERRFE